VTSSVLDAGAAVYNLINTPL